MQTDALLGVLIHLQPRWWVIPFLSFFFFNLCPLPDCQLSSVHFIGDSSHGLLQKKIKHTPTKPNILTIKKKKKILPNTA